MASDPLRDLDFALAQLRHLYSQMVGGSVRYPAEAARGLLGPQIVTLERLRAALASVPTTDEKRLTCAASAPGGDLPTKGSDAGGDGTDRRQP